MEAPLELAIEGLGHRPGRSPRLDDHVYLAGRPPLRGYLHFMTTIAQDGAAERAHVEEWRAAQEHIARLEIEEAGWADGAPILPLGKSLQPLREELLQDPIFRNAFDTLPTDIALIELDRLVVYQRHINLAYAAMVRERLGPAPDEESLFRVCLPTEHPRTEACWMQTHNDTWVCVSPSNDLRLLDSTLLDPSQVRGYAATGPLSGVVAVMVGFGSNFLHVYHAEGRLILNNGSHRAYALRDMGFTRVPCIVRHIASRDELGAFVSSDLRRNPDLYLTHPRPPLLKDYFDPKLRKVVPAPRRNHQVRVTVRVEQTDYPAL